MLPVVMGSAEHLDVAGLQMTTRAHAARDRFVGVQRPPAGNLRDDGARLARPSGPAHGLLDHLLPFVSFAAATGGHRVDPGALHCAPPCRAKWQAVHDVASPTVSTRVMADRA